MLAGVDRETQAPAVVVTGRSVRAVVVRVNSRHGPFSADGLDDIDRRYAPASSPTGPSGNGTFALIESGRVSLVARGLPEDPEAQTRSAL